MLGEMTVPRSAYWGVHTARAVANFNISGVSIQSHPELIRALSCIKKAAALANTELGLLDGRRAFAIVSACDEIAAGGLRDQFVVDAIQGGAGTSTNMNANEVIANRALELLGQERGNYDYLHPNEHVNLSQSTNDAYPTSVKLALIFAVVDLFSSMEKLRRAFSAKAEEFHDVLKIGRTQLQDAVPMTAGQEFASYSVMVQEDIDRLREALENLYEINMGATAIGTGINAHPQYAASVCRHLAAVTNLPFVTASNLIESTQDCGVFVLISSMLKRYAVKLSKICDDLRLLSSGPRTGLGELRLPERQAGSSIMPGKVNPVIPEVVNQVAFEVIGNDLTVTMAAAAGQLQLNAFEPIIAHSLLKSIRHLAAASETLADRCVAGIQVNAEKMRSHVDSSIALATALNPYLGYETTTKIALLALESGTGVMEVTLQAGLMDQEELLAVLSPARLAGLSDAVVARSRDASAT